MPTLDSAIVYPGAVLFEGTMLSEGRGTTRPFEVIGRQDRRRAPVARDERARAAGRPLQAVFFEPTFQKHARQSCAGCQLHVTDRRAFAPLRTAVELIQEFRAERASRGAILPTGDEHDKEPIDILYGSDLLRRTIDGNGDVRALVGSWRAEEEFRRQAERYLLY